MTMQKILRYTAAVFVLGFGLLSVFASTSVILDLFGMRAKEGNYVLFVVWANFFCGILYLPSAYGFFSIRQWTKWALASALVILIIALVFLNIHINNGGLYETKTVGALVLRGTLTMVLTIIAFFMKDKEHEHKK